MGTTRRAFIAAVGTAPAAAVLAQAPVALAVPESLEPPIPAATPYRQYPWRWFVSHDGSIYHDDFDTLAEALEYAAKSDYAIVAECQQQDFSLDVSGDEVIELLYGHNEEYVGEGEFIDPTSEQEKDLGEMVTAAIEAWAIKHNISLTAWSFREVRNKTEAPSLFECDRPSARVNQD